MYFIFAVEYFESNSKVFRFFFRYQTCQSANNCSVSIENIFNLKPSTLCDTKEHANLQLQ